MPKPISIIFCYILNYFAVTQKDFHATSSAESSSSISIFLLAIMSFYYFIEILVEKTKDSEPSGHLSKQKIYPRNS